MYCPFCGTNVKKSDAGIYCFNKKCKRPNFFSITDIPNYYLNISSGTIDSNKYMKETEFVINLIHEFEREEAGKEICISMLCYEFFIKCLSEKIDQGRFSEYKKFYNKDLIILSGDDLSNKYHLEMKWLSIKANPKKVKDSIHFSLVVNDSVQDFVSPLVSSTDLPNTDSYFVSPTNPPVNRMCKVHKIDYHNNEVIFITDGGPLTWVGGPMYHEGERYIIKRTFVTRKEGLKGSLADNYLKCVVVEKDL